MNQPALRYLALIIACLAPLLARAATYHVAPHGDDAHPGTAAEPFRTVQRGADVLSPGDTLYLRDGVYVEKVTFARSGTADRPIVIAGHPGEQAVIDGRLVLPRGQRSTKITNYLPLVLVTGSHVELRDLTIRNSRARGLQVGDGKGYLTGGTAPVSHVLVRNVRVSHTWGTGFVAIGSDRVTFEDCEAWECVESNAPPRRGIGNWAATMGATDATRTTFWHCTARQGHGEGIFDLRSEHTLIEDCVSYDHYKIIMYLDNSRHSTVRRNVLLSTDDRTFWRYGVRPTPGLSLNNEPYPRQNFGTGQHIHHNLVLNTGTGISIWHFGVKGSSYTDSEIAHNAFVSTRPATEAAYGLGINAEGSSNIRFHHNLIRFPAGRVASGSTAGWTYAQNAWSEPPPASFVGPGDILAADHPPAGGRDAALIPLAPAAFALGDDAGETTRALVTAVRAGRFSLPQAGLAPSDESANPGRAAGVAAPLGAELDLAPLAEGAPASAEDRRRGFTDAELAAARSLVPRMPDVPVVPAVPRTVTVDGRLFVDGNGNQQADKDEPGLAGVVVSDGETLTRTDAEGRYEFTFKVDDEPHHRFVFAVLPDGHAASGPWFLRAPAGDDQMTYIANFGFVPTPASGEGISFLVTGGPRLDETATMLAAAKLRAASTAGTDAAFLVCPGGLTAGGRTWEWDLHDRVSAAARIPVREAFGPSDGARAGSTVDFEERVGPPWCSWDAGGVHFVQVVSASERLGPAARTRQERWLQADLGSLAAGTPVVVVTHEPFAPAWVEARRSAGTNIVAQIAARAIDWSGNRAVPVFAAKPGEYRKITLNDGAIVAEALPDSASRLPHTGQ